MNENANLEEDIKNQLGNYLIKEADRAFKNKHFEKAFEIFAKFLIIFQGVRNEGEHILLKTIFQEYLTSKIIFLQLAVNGEYLPQKVYFIQYKRKLIEQYVLASFQELEIIDNILLPNVGSFVHRIMYYLMKADILKYAIELSKYHAKLDLMKSSLELYGVIYVLVKHSTEDDILKKFTKDVFMSHSNIVNQEISRLKKERLNITHDRINEKMLIKLAQNQECKEPLNVINSVKPTWSRKEKIRRQVFLGHVITMSTIYEKII